MLEGSDVRQTPFSDRVHLLTHRIHTTISAAAATARSTPVPGPLYPHARGGSREDRPGRPRSATVMCSATTDRTWLSLSCMARDFRQVSPNCPPRRRLRASALYSGFLHAIADQGVCRALQPASYRPGWRSLAHLENSGAIPSGRPGTRRGAGVRREAPFPLRWASAPHARVRPRRREPERFHGRAGRRAACRSGPFGPSVRTERLTRPR